MFKCKVFKKKYFGLQKGCIVTSKHKVQNGMEAIALLYMLYACNDCDLMSIYWIKAPTLVSLNQVVCFGNPASYLTKKTTHQL